GKRVAPILVKDDGEPMLESMDMVGYIDGLGDPVLTGPQRSEIAACADTIVAKTVPLTWPRYPLLGLPEFGTVAALDHYVVRKRKQLGDLVELRAKTREHIDALTPELEKLDRLIDSPLAVNGRLSLDDIRVLPLLRSAAVVKGLRFPHKVREYFEAMMERIGFACGIGSTCHEAHTCSCRRRRPPECDPILFGAVRDAADRGEG